MLVYLAFHRPTQLAEIHQTRDVRQADPVLIDQARKVIVREGFERRDDRLAFSLKTADRSVERLEDPRHRLVSRSAVGQYANEAPQRLIVPKLPIERASKRRPWKRNHHRR